MTRKKLPFLKLFNLCNYNSLTLPVNSAPPFFFPLLLFALFFLLAPTVNAEVVKAVKISHPPTLDGKLQEDFWQVESVSHFRQIEPIDGAPATEKTIVTIVYDESNLYIGARLLDSQPDKIISRLGRRDDEIESDWFIVAIDPYFDHRSGYELAINPSGSIRDARLYNDESKDYSWDAVWEGATKRDALGWTVEICLPFDELRFQEKATYTWGINFWRIIKRKNEIATYSWHPREESGYVSRFAQLEGIAHIKPSRYLEILPYTVGRADFRPSSSGGKQSPNLAENAGFDICSGLLSNLTLNLTINPDFGQVEVDPAVVNISDQETYYQEKRPFFIEGAEVFQFGYGGASSIQNFGWKEPSFFYSRRIGRSPQGLNLFHPDLQGPEWTTILAAAKITGKLGPGWNVGFLTAITPSEYGEITQGSSTDQWEIEPLTSYSILRLQKESTTGNTGLGLMTTGVFRKLNDSPLQSYLTKRAFTLAVDGWAFLDANRTWVITGWLGGTSIQGEPEAMTKIQTSSLHYFQRPDVDYVQVNETATKLNGYGGRLYLNKQRGQFVFNAALGFLSPGFHAMDLGYHYRGDIINGHLQVGYWNFHPGRILRQWQITLTAYRSYDFSGNRTDENYILQAKGQLLNYWSGLLYLSYDPPRYNHYLTRGGPMAFYPSGIMRRLSVQSDNRRSLVWQISTHYRTHPNGSYNWSISTGLRWKLRSNLSISLSPGYSWRYSEGQYITKVNDPFKTETYGVRYILSDIIHKTFPLEIRINWTFTPKLSLQAYLQPYLAVGDYFWFKELAAARTFEFNYFGQEGSTIFKSGNIYQVDPDGLGPASSFSFRDPDFNLKSLRGTVVLRWEYRGGSTIYLVWTQKRADYSHPGDWNFGRDFQQIFLAPGENIFLLKISHRFKL